MFQSLRWRLIFSYSFLALLVVSVVGSITYKLTEHYVENRELQGLHGNAQAIALQAESLYYSPFAHFELQQLAETSAFLGDMRVRILDERHASIADSGNAEKTEKLMLMIPGESDGPFPGVILYPLYPDDDGFMMEFPGEFLEGMPSGANVTVIERHDGPWGKQFTFGQIHLSDADQLRELIESPTVQHRSDSTVLQPVGNPEYPIGYVELSEPIDYGVNLLDELKQALITAGVGAVILAVLFGLWNSYRLAAPLKSLAHTSAEMGEGNLAVRANLETGGEIGALGDQFNQMADSLQHTVQQLEAERDALRRFIADASHELRTPITALKNFNTLLQGPAADDSAVQHEFLTESQSQIERLEWITANLLDLSRLDAGLLDLDIAEHDLRDIIESAAVPFKPLAADKSIHLRTHLPKDPVVFSADRPRFEMAIGNLLDNAIKFTPEGGEVEMFLESEGDQVSLVVSDNGLGISHQDLPHIFGRFYRGHGLGLEGSGLGLAIVKSVVEAHGGQIRVESQSGAGTSFRLLWDFSDPRH